MKYTRLIKKLDDQEKTDLKFVLKLAKSCNFDARHTKHVTRLALKIFDDLQDLHNLNQKEKHWLLYAGILHDIGVHTEGPVDHHKTALNIIMDNPILQFDNKTRLIIGSIARYHRGALPSERHDHYSSLSPDEKMLFQSSQAFCGFRMGWIIRIKTESVKSKPVLLKKPFTSNALRKRQP